MARKIWHGDYTVDEANGMISPQNILGCLGLQFTALGDDYIEATLPVDTRTHQPYGILHGGATCVLAETLGSVASLLVVNRETQFAVGSVITLAGVVLHLAGVPWALVIAAAAAFVAAFLNSVFSYCLGCQIYLLLARAGLRVVVLETDVAQLSGVLGLLLDREVELLGAPHGVPAQHHGLRWLAQSLAVIVDGSVQVGDGQGDVETFHDGPRFRLSV